MSTKKKGGRPRKVDEQWARRVCMDAIIKKYGSIEAGIEVILSGKEERLKTFIWTHVLGTPPTEQKIKLSNSKGGDLEPGALGGVLKVEVVRTIHNKDVPVDGNKNDDSTRLSDL